MARPKRTCSIADCNRQSKGHGWCSLHYKRWRKTGSPLTVKPRARQTLCSIHGCDSPHEARGWCQRHYKRWHTHGDPLGVVPKVVRLCSITGCERKHYGRGWCELHHNRWEAHGDPLAPTRPVAAAANFLRDVVMHYDGDECLEWPFLRISGYGTMNHKGRTRHVSTVICEEIHGPAPTPIHQAAHLCGRGHLGCVTKRHLVWKTPAENCADKIIHDTHNRGERNPFSKLTEEDVHVIRSLHGKASNVRLAKQFGVSTTTIFHIQARNKWAWLEDRSPTSETSARRILPCDRTSGPA